jgi:hypothetical protein
VAHIDRHPLAFGNRGLYRVDNLRNVNAISGLLTIWGEVQD